MLIKYFARLSDNYRIILLQFELSPELIGVIFLVMAAAYAVSSPLWGWVADKMVC